jgi:hypothetical protein
MPVVMGTVSGAGLDYLAFAGRVSLREALTFPERLQPDSPEVGVRWITVFDTGADLSDLDSDCLQDLKARLRSGVSQLRGKGPFRMILVAGPTDNGQLIERWRAMTAPDPTYESNPEAAHSIREACLRHGLTEEQCEAAETEIGRDLRDALVLSNVPADLPAIL